MMIKNPTRKLLPIKIRSILTFSRKFALIDTLSSNCINSYPDCRESAAQMNLTSW